MKNLAILILALSIVFLLSGCEDESIEEEENRKRSKPVSKVSSTRINKPGVGFKYDMIVNDGNADEFFRRFLEKVSEEKIRTDNIFKISEIIEYIPYSESMGIDEDTYNYYILTMLSGLIKRDYFIFIDNPDLRYEFTNIANNPNRKNDIWLTKYGDKKFRINPKYVRM